MKENKKRLALIGCALLLVSLAIGATGMVSAQNAEKTNLQVSDKESDSGIDEQDIQEPLYTSSITVPESSLSEEQESSELAKYATISEKPAETVALQLVPGELGKIGLENENGNVVYSVEIMTSTGITDVKVDAGNGHVLCIENDDYEDQGT